jgi:PadR family transcriptional regulator PadR
VDLQNINAGKGCFVTRKWNVYNLFKKGIDNHYTSCYDVYRKGGYVMDIQLKRGFLDVCVLAAIKNEDSYGYKIIKDLKPYIALSESTLYTILKRLESANMLTVRTAEHCGRLRKYYHITEIGRIRIEDFKKEWDEMISIYRFIAKEENAHE